MRVVSVLLALLLSGCALTWQGRFDPSETEAFVRYFPPHNEPDPLIGGIGGVTRWQIGGRTQARLSRLGEWEVRLEAAPTLSLLVDWPDGVESDHGGRPDLAMLDFRLFLRRGALEFGFVGRRSFWFNQDEDRDARYYNGLELRWVWGR